MVGACRFFDSIHITLPFCRCLPYFLSHGCALDSIVLSVHYRLADIGQSIHSSPTCLIFNSWYLDWLIRHHLLASPTYQKKSNWGGTVGQEAVELICQNARKTRQNEAFSLLPLLSTKMKLILMKVSKKMTFGQKNIFDLVNGGP